MNNSGCLTECLWVAAAVPGGGAPEAPSTPYCIRTPNCTAARDSGGFLRGFMPFLTIFFIATLALPAIAQTPSPSPAAAQQSAAPAGDIHDIRGVISIPYEWLWAAYILAGVALAAALYAAWHYFRKHAKTKAKLPFEIALERLEAARPLMKTDTVREYAFAVSEIIRVYIEQRFGEKAARRTTEEFLADLLLETGTPLAQHSALLEDFLHHCDLIKFARWGATEHELESMHESARAFILDTRPQPEAARPAKAASSALPQLAPAK
jgi:hypothetical protein